MSSWETGYGDFEMKPDFSTLRPVSWIPGTAICMADLQWHDGVAGRRLAAADPACASSTGSPSAAGTRWPPRSSSSSCSATPTRRRGTRRYRDLEPGNLYNVDYSILGTTRLEPLLGRIRREMAASDLPVENSKGECNFGQHEVNFRYADAVSRRRHPHDLQERREGDRRPGGHVDLLHGQVRRARGQLVPHPPVAAQRTTTSRCSPTTTRVFERFLAGQLACLRELTLFLAPNINSYKRYAEGSFAPTAVGLGSRQPDVRVPRDRPRPVAADRVPRARAATSTPTWRCRR